MENFDGKTMLSWFSMKAVAFHFDGNLKKNLTFSRKILMENFDGKKKSSAGSAWKLLHSIRCQIDDYGLGLALSNNCK